MDVDIPLAHGNRNKKAKTTPKLVTKKGLAMKEKKTQQEELEAKEAKKARRRALLAQQAGRG